MKAVVLHEYGGPENLKFEENFPDPQVSGDTVLIATAAASVNPIDWKIRSGARHKDFPQTFPAILGSDVSGVVRAVGANVKNFKPGDRVVAFSNRTYAELVAVPESDVTHLPDGVDLVDAAALPLIALTGDQLVRHAANLQKGQTLLVTGALGSVGRAAVHAAKKMGAQVIAGVRKKQVDEARSLGVAGVLAIDNDEAIAKFGCPSPKLRRAVISRPCVRRTSCEVWYKSGHVLPAAAFPGSGRPLFLFTSRSSARKSGSSPATVGLPTTQAKTEAYTVR
jgi:NADPH:quinone reductase-like Zn-dependent oxidoreductase